MVSREPDLSVLVVSFNTRELTLASIRSLFAETTTPAFEVIVVDNASADGSGEAIREEFPQARVIELAENVGFGAGNNRAASEAKGRRLLLLNPDTVVLNGAVSRLWEFAEQNSEARIWGGRTVFSDGSLNPASCWGAPTVWSTICLASGLASAFPDSGWLHPEALGSWPRDSLRQVDIVSGCFLLIDARLWRELGGFHRTFFMYGEDADLCLRARRIGAKPLICPDATIVHYGGASEPVRADKMVRLFTAKAQMFHMHWGGWRGILGLRLLDAWALWRVIVFGVLGAFHPRSRRRAMEWRTIWAGRATWRRAFHTAAK